MKLTIALTSFTLALAGSCLAEPPKDPSPEQAAVIANDRAFEAAYAKADVKAMAAFFTEDGDYVADDGRTFSGRAEVEAALKAGVLANRGSKLAISVESVRVLTPETVLEKGTSTVTAKNGNTSTDQYTAVHVKQDGKWKIAHLVESPTPEITAHDHLEELSWLAGQWEETNKDDGVTVSTHYSWARGGNFLTRNVTVKREGEVTLEGWQVIGWDPVEERLRSWTFDDEGGFAEGYFTREGERWLLRETGVAPDGRRTGADNTITKVNANQFVWESHNRTLDGDPRPSIGRIEINRVKKD